MIEMKVDTDNTSGVKAAFKMIEQHMSGRLVRRLQDLGYALLMDEIFKNFPETRKLQKGWVWKKTGQNEYTLENTFAINPAAKIRTLEGGSKRTLIFPVTKKAMHFHWKGKEIFAKEVERGPVQGYYFIEDASKRFVRDADPIINAWFRKIPLVGRFL